MLLAFLSQSAWAFQKKKQNVVSTTPKKDYILYLILLCPTYLNLWLCLCFLGGEPHWYGYSDASLQHLLEGPISGWKSLGERLKGVQLAQGPGGHSHGMSLSLTIVEIQ